MQVATRTGACFKSGFMWVWFLRERACRSNMLSSSPVLNSIK